MFNGSKNYPRMTLGILMDFDETWMGGFNYIVNMIKTMSFLPKHEIPNIVVIVRNGTESGLKRFADYFPAVKIYDLSKAPPWIRLLPAQYRQRIWAKYRNLLTRLIIKMAGPDILFPVKDPHDLVFPARGVGWIPDFQHKYLPQFFSQEEIMQRDYTCSWFADKARFMIFSSDCARKDYEKFYPDYKSKNFIYSFCTVLNKDFKIKSLEYLKDKYLIGNKYILLPNQFWMHKNHYMVFQVLARLLAEGCEIQLVCTGSSSEYRNNSYFKELMSFKETNKLDIKILGLVPQEDLYSLYYYAHAVMQPSLFEGWSSIVEDCRAFAKRMLLSDIPVHREQNPPGATYFNPVDPDDLREKLLVIWSHEELETPSFDELIAIQEKRIKETAYSLLSSFEACRGNN